LYLTINRIEIDRSLRCSSIWGVWLQSSRRTCLTLGKYFEKDFCVSGVASSYKLEQMNVGVLIDDRREIIVQCSYEPVTENSVESNIMQCRVKSKCYCLILLKITNNTVTSFIRWRRFVQFHNEKFILS